MKFFSVLPAQFAIFEFGEFCVLKFNPHVLLNKRFENKLNKWRETFEKEK